MHGKFLGSISPCFMGILRTKKTKKTKPNPKGAHEELRHNEVASIAPGREEWRVERQWMMKKHTEKN